MTLTIAECGAFWTDANRLKNDSERFRWECAPTALEVFGTARTLDMANALDGSVDTVHNLAKAQRLYLYLYGWDEQKAILARSIYGYVRFSEVWTKHMRYEFSPAECLEFLVSDLSNGAMSATIEDIHNPEPEWYRAATDSKFTKKLKRFAESVDGDQPARLTRLARLMLATIERIIK
jgi:hypothetical protein